MAIIFTILGGILLLVYSFSHKKESTLDKESPKVIIFLFIFFIIINIFMISISNPWEILPWVYILIINITSLGFAIAVYLRKIVKKTEEIR